MAGKLITIYGVNNIGKSTHAKKLVERLRAEGYKAEYVKYPIYDIEPSGPFINSVLREGREVTGEELQLWFAVNRHQYESKLREMLDGGAIVVAEDYRGTGIAWGMARGVDEDWLESVNSKVIPEDFVILMEGKRGIEAKEEGHAHEDNDELFEKCVQTHDHLAKKHGWKRVAVQEKIEDTAELMWQAVEEVL